MSSDLIKVTAEVSRKDMEELYKAYKAIAKKPENFEMFSTMILEHLFWMYGQEAYIDFEVWR